MVWNDWDRVLNSRSRRQLPFSALAKKVLEVAQREALSRGSEHIGDEDLLLGIVRID